MELCSQYLIEEIALFTTVVQMGWEVDVYPGEELSTLVEIAEGKYPNVPEPLKRRKNVALKLKLDEKEGIAATASASTSGLEALKANGESLSQEQAERAIAHRQS